MNGPDPTLSLWGLVHLLQGPGDAKEVFSGELWQQQSWHQALPSLMLRTALLSSTPTPEVMRMIEDENCCQLIP